MPALSYAEAKGGAPALPRIGEKTITPHTVAQIVQMRAMAAGFGRRDLGGHSFTRGALTMGMDRGIHPAKLKRFGRHKNFNVLSEYLVSATYSKSIRSMASCKPPEIGDALTARCDVPS